MFSQPVSDEKYSVVSKLKCFKAKEQVEENNEDKEPNLHSHNMLNVLIFCTITFIDHTHYKDHKWVIF